MNSFDFSVCEIEVSYSHRVPAKSRINVTTSTDAYKACTQFWPGYDHVEYFYVLLLNRSNQILGLTGLKGDSPTVIDVRVIFRGPQSLRHLDHRSPQPPLGQPHAMMPTM